MNNNQLYNQKYMSTIMRKARISKTMIIFLSFFMVVYAFLSLLLSSMDKYQWLLYLNMPIDIIGIIGIFVIAEVYFPVFKWELHFYQKIQKISKDNVIGQVTHIKHDFRYFDNQRMVSILVQEKNQSKQIYVRPWLFNDFVHVGDMCTFEIVSNIITAYEVGEQS